MQAFDIDPNLYLPLYIDFKVVLYRIFNTLREGRKNRRIFNIDLAATKTGCVDLVCTAVGRADLTSSQRLAGVIPSRHQPLRYPEPLVF